MLTIVPSFRRTPKYGSLLLAPSSAIELGHTGQRVLMLYSAFPCQKFGEQPGAGVVYRVAAPDPDQTKALLAGSLLDKASRYYRVVVKPDRHFVDVAGELHALPANMRAEANALLDRAPSFPGLQ